MLLKAEIPKPVAGNIIELFVSVQSDKNATQFDTAICATTFQSDASLSRITWETLDL